MFKQFKRDPFFILKYNIVTILLLALASVVLFNTWSSLGETPYSWVLLLCVLPLAVPNFWTISFSALSVVAVSVYFGLFVVGLGDAWLIPVGIIVGLQAAYLMHNAAHGNFKPNWLNRVVGELCGLQHLIGFPGWVVPHIVHHQYPDDPARDPHPPEHMSFTRFLSEMGPCMSRVARQIFFQQWREREDTARIWAAMAYTGMLARYLRAVFLLLLLGSKAFVLAYLISKIVNVLFYVHFNYYTHRPTEEGSIEVLNLNHNWYYKLMNATMAGVYYHKNHHAKASLFDPRRLDAPQKESLISYRYPEGEEVLPAR